jgi:surfeit locus 1 family protein
LGLALQARRFAPRLHWTALSLVGVLLFSMLGRWQLHRADEKRVLFEGFAAGSAAVMELPTGLDPASRYQRVRARGRYDSSRQFLLDNMSHDGVPGYHVLTPLLRANGSVVVVDRGFVPSSGDRSVLPSVRVSEMPREVTGRADFLPRPAVELAAPPASGWPRLVSFPDTAGLAAALGAAVHPQVLLLDAAEPDGYLRDWQPPGMPPGRHIGYAVQWFGLAAAVLVAWIVLGFQPAAPSR